MNISLKDIPIRDIVNGYVDSIDTGVRGYCGRLNIRPPYQREFVYKDAQRDAVIDTVFKGFPLNTIYWSKNADGTFEVLDGQQRTISICQFCEGDFSINLNGRTKWFHNLTDDEKEKILSYELKVYICEGNESEKLEWFKTINIAGEKLREQELRNAVYTGSWLEAAKRYFSKNGCAAYELGKKYLNGSPIRQDYLETTLKWISNGDIEGYMSAHQHDPNADELRYYFEDVIRWVERYFPTYRAKLMQGLPWGDFYNAHKGDALKSDEMEAAIVKLIADEEVENKKGIYAYLLTGAEKHLNLRAFPDDIAQRKYDEQQGKCPMCGKEFRIDEMEADHIKPWHKGGKTTEDNCQMLCRHCNRTKSGK